MFLSTRTSQVHNLFENVYSVVHKHFLIAFQRMFLAHGEKVNGQI